MPNRALPYLLTLPSLLLAAVVIFWPESVTYWIDSGPKVDPNSIDIKIDLPTLGDNTDGGLPGLNLPPLGQ